MSRTFLWIAAGVVAVILFSVGTGAIVSTVKDRAFEARETQREQEREALTKEADEHRAKREEAIKQAESWKGKAQILEAAVEAAGQHAEQAREKAEEYDRQYLEEMERIGKPVDPCERLRRVCSRLRLAPKDCQCE